LILTDLVKKSFNRNNSDIIATQTKVPILDPLMKTRINLPTRASTCKHIEVFFFEIPEENNFFS
jgi:hypothetical protein